MSYRLKLWPGIRYGIATLATPLKTASSLLDVWDYKMLSFLGVNRHIKRGGDVFLEPLEEWDFCPSK